MCILIHYVSYSRDLDDYLCANILNLGIYFKLFAIENDTRIQSISSNSDFLFITVPVAQHTIWLDEMMIQSHSCSAEKVKANPNAIKFKSIGSLSLELSYILRYSV